MWLQAFKDLEQCPTQTRQLRRKWSETNFLMIRLIYNESQNFLTQTEFILYSAVLKILFCPWAETAHFDVKSDVRTLNLK